MRILYGVVEKSVRIRLYWDLPKVTVNMAYPMSSGRIIRSRLCCSITLRVYVPLFKTTSEVLRISPFQHVNKSPESSENATILGLTHWSTCNYRLGRLKGDTLIREKVPRRLYISSFELHCRRDDHKYKRGCIACCGAIKAALIWKSWIRFKQNVPLGRFRISNTPPVESGTRLLRAVLRHCSCTIMITRTEPKLSNSVTLKRLRTLNVETSRIHGCRFQKFQQFGLNGFYFTTHDTLRHLSSIQPSLWIFIDLSIRERRYTTMKWKVL
jgi:hypothetical protein